MSLSFRHAVCSAFFLMSCCFHVCASTAPVNVQGRIFQAVLPMNAADADALMHKLMAFGLDQKWMSPFRDYLRTTEFFNSMPWVLDAGDRPLCVATALRYDIDQVMLVSPEKNAETEQAVTAFLLAHEASHCERMLAQLAGEHSRPYLGGADIADQDLWVEESLADHAARLSVRGLGKAGENATAAWERYRLFGFLSGDLEHWTTPLIQMIQKADARDDVPLDAAALGVMGGNVSYSAMAAGWRRLRKALFAGEDQSTEQVTAWASAVQAFPMDLRPAIPSLDSLRALSRQLWPDAPDWRRKAIRRP